MTVNGVIQRLACLEAKLICVVYILRAKFNSVCLILCG